MKILDLGILILAKKNTMQNSSYEMVIVSHVSTLHQMFTYYI